MNDVTGIGGECLPSAAGRLFSSPQTFPRDVELFRQNRKLTEILYLAEGIVKLTCLKDDGQEAILAVMLPGV